MCTRPHNETSTGVMFFPCTGPTAARPSVRLSTRTFRREWHARRPRRPSTSITLLATEVLLPPHGGAVAGRLLRRVRSIASSAARGRKNAGFAAHARSVYRGRELEPRSSTRPTTRTSRAGHHLFCSPQLQWMLVNGALRVLRRSVHASAGIVYGWAEEAPPRAPSSRRIASPEPTVTQPRSEFDESVDAFLRRRPLTGARTASSTSNRTESSAVPAVVSRSSFPAIDPEDVAALTRARSTSSATGSTAA